MLFRFSLYGFLKNQRYFEPFLILALLARGVPFWLLGVLISVREIAINLMEIPSGAVADVLGRRRSMIASFAAYIVSFVLFAFATPARLGQAGMIAGLFAAMVLFSVGEAFRTGTHKAMIFAWLRRQGRADEKTKVYGFTRSWSQIGSAVCALIAPVLVIVFRDYEVVFLACLVPYALNIVNFLSYPSYLDGDTGRRRNVGEVVATLAAALRRSLRHRPLRRLLAESMGFEGTFKVSKDFLQPVLKTAAVGVLAGAVASWPWLGRLGDVQRTALLVGLVYAVLHVLSSVASRRADALARRAGSDERGGRWLWTMNLGCFVLLSGSLLLGLAGRPGAALAGAVVAFVALFILQNFWRPILIGRVADQSDEKQMATVLSVESQCKSLFAAVLAPALWWTVGRTTEWLGEGEPLRFLPVGLLGVAVAAAMLLTSPRPAASRL